MVRQPGTEQPARFYADRAYSGAAHRWTPKLVGWYLPGGSWAVPADRIERAAIAQDLTGLRPEDLAGPPHRVIGAVIDIIERSVRETAQRLNNEKGQGHD